jgi:hypothetical protein
MRCARWCPGFSSVSQARPGRGDRAVARAFAADLLLARGGAFRGWSRPMFRSLSHGRYSRGRGRAGQRTGRSRGIPCRSTPAIQRWRGARAAQRPEFEFRRFSRRRRSGRSELAHCGWRLTGRFMPIGGSGRIFNDLYGISCLNPSRSVGQAILTGADLDRGCPAASCGWTAK